jgi:hypothetical protein
MTPLWRLWIGALDGHIVVALRRDGGDRVIIVPDSMIIELAVNGHALSGGITVGRGDGQAVLVFVLVYGSDRLGQ